MDRPAPAPPPKTESAQAAGPRSPLELFLTFTVLALQGFGGVLAVAQRELVDGKGWLTREEFVDAYSLAQLLPGPNVVNISLMLGDRFFGWRGALAASSGMLAVPLVIVLALASGYNQFADHPAVSGALRGMGAVAAGLLLAMAIKLLATLRRNPMGPGACALLGVVTVVLIAVLRLPLVWVLPTMGVAGWCWARWRLAQMEKRP